MDFNAEQKKIFEKLFENIADGMIIYHKQKKEVIMLNAKAKENFCLDKHKSCTKAKAKNIIENIIKEKEIFEKELRNEVFCDLTKRRKYLLIKVIPTGIRDIFLLKTTDISHVEESKDISKGIADTIVNEKHKIIAIININGKFEYVNDKMAETFDFAPESVIGTNLFSLGLKHNEFQNIKIWKTITRGNIWQGEIHTNNSSGEDLFLHATIKPVMAGQKIDKFIITAEDITEKKFYETRFLKEEKKKNIILNTLPDTILVVNCGGYIKDYKGEKINCLIPDDDIIGKKIGNIGMPENLVRKITNAVKFCTKAQKIKQFNYEYVEKERVYECRTVALSDEEVVCIIREITKRVYGEKLLKNREKSYKSMVENFPSGIIIHKNNRIVYCNQTALKLLGCKSLKPLRKYNIFDLIHDDYKALSKQRLEKALSGEELDFMEFPVLRLSDKQFVHFETKPVLFDYYGNKVCQIVIRDMSVQKRLIKETIRAQLAERSNKEIRKEVKMRKEAEKVLKKSLQEKELLIKEIHHRVKNNMQVMTSILNLQANAIKNEEVKRMFEESQNRIKSMALVHETIYSDKDFSNINFKAYFDSLADNLLRTDDAKQKNIKIVKNIDNLYLPVSLSVPCGLIINEIIALSTKRFFVEISKKCYIFVEANVKNNEVSIQISDNAKQKASKQSLEKKYPLSYLLIYALIEQINGEISIESKKETKFKIKFNI